MHRTPWRQPQHHPALFAIDELAALKLPMVDTYLATVGGAGITMLIYAQTITQLMDAYTEHRAQSIHGNCAYQVYYPSRDLATARQMSELFGTTITPSFSSSRGGRLARDGLREQLGPALDPAQIMGLPESTVLLLMPARGRQYRLLAERLDPRGRDGFAWLPPAPAP